MTQTSIIQTDTRLAELGVELETCEKAWNNYEKDEHSSGEASDAEGSRLVEWEGSISRSIVNEQPANVKGWRVKITAVERLNSLQGMTWEDRIKDANSNAEIITWSIMRDLAGQI